MSSPISTVSDRLRDALWGMFVGDALAMPGAQVQGGQGGRESPKA
jgi:hypothetical protein